MIFYNLKFHPFLGLLRKKQEIKCVYIIAPYYTKERLAWFLETHEHFFSHSGHFCPLIGQYP